MVSVGLAEGSPRSILPRSPAVRLHFLRRKSRFLGIGSIGSIRREAEEPRTLQEASPENGFMQKKREN